MKDSLVTTLRLVIADRPVVLLLAAVILSAVTYCVYAGFALQPSDIQVAVHYSAYGETHFYRSQWYYLINFIVMGILVGIVHSGLMLKFYAIQRRQLSIAIGWLSLMMIMILWLIARAVFAVAFL